MLYSVYHPEAYQGQFPVDATSSLATKALKYSRVYKGGNPLYVIWNPVLSIDAIETGRVRTFTVRDEAYDLDIIARKPIRVPFFMNLQLVPDVVNQAQVYSMGRLATGIIKMYSTTRPTDSTALNGTLSAVAVTDPRNAGEAVSTNAFTEAAMTNKDAIVMCSPSDGIYAVCGPDFSQTLSPITYSGTIYEGMSAHVIRTNYTNDSDSIFFHYDSFSVSPTSSDIKYTFINIGQPPPPFCSSTFRVSINVVTGKRKDAYERSEPESEPCSTRSRHTNVTGSSARRWNSDNIVPNLNFFERRGMNLPKKTNASSSSSTTTPSNTIKRTRPSEPILVEDDDPDNDKEWVEVSEEVHAAGGFKNMAKGNVDTCVEHPPLYLTGKVNQLRVSEHYIYVGADDQVITGGSEVMRTLFVPTSVDEIDNGSIFNMEFTLYPEKGRRIVGVSISQTANVASSFRYMSKVDTSIRHHSVYTPLYTSSWRILVADGFNASQNIETMCDMAFDAVPTGYLAPYVKGNTHTVTGTATRGALLALYNDPSSQIARVGVLHNLNVSNHIVNKYDSQVTSEAVSNYQASGMFTGGGFKNILHKIVRPALNIMSDIPLTHTFANIANKAVDIADCALSDYNH